MKFSIVTPSLNQGDYIQRTIDSVIRQQGDFSIEYIVRDGGSTDSTVESLKATERMLAEGPDLGNGGVEFRWVSEKDGGQSAAINAGLRQAHGDIVAYLNSDDMYRPGAFAAVAEAFRRGPQTDFVYGDGVVVDERDDPLWTWLARPYDFDVLTRHHEAWNSASNYIMQTSTFWRRSVVDKIGLFDEAFHFAMDLEYWVRAGAAGLRLEHLPVELSNFRMIEGTKTASSPTAFWPDTIEIFRRHAPGSLLSGCAYYFYNLVLSHGWNVDDATAEYRRELARVHALPPAEREELEAVTARGRRLGLVVCATDALRRGDDDASRRLYAAAQRDGAGGLGAHPLVWRYRVRRALGARARGWFETAAERWVASYRRRKIDYRYAQAQSE